MQLPGIKTERTLEDSYWHKIMKRSNMDELISVLGKGNRFQVFVLILLAVNYIPLVFNHVIMAFYGSTPVHKCQIASGSTGLQGPNSTSPAGMWVCNVALYAF